MTPRRTMRIALATLAGHNLVQNFLLNQRGYVTGNLVVSVAMIGLGRASGLTWEEMGLRPGSAKEGLRVGARASAGAVLATALLFAHPRWRRYFRDERAAPSQKGSVWRRALIRFPLGTALFEEVTFRGVMPGLLRRRHRPLSAELLSAGAFASWHLIPTARALSGNPLGKEIPLRGRALAVAAGSLLAGGVGLAFSAMRRRSGSVMAPWLAHASLNTVSYLAGLAAWKLGDPV